MTDNQDSVVVFLTLIVLVIVGSLIIQSIRQTQTEGTSAYNVTVSGEQFLLGLPAAIEWVLEDPLQVALVTLIGALAAGFGLAGWYHLRD